jgi:hypothetical protein
MPLSAAEINEEKALYDKIVSTAPGQERTFFPDVRKSVGTS